MTHSEMPNYRPLLSLLELTLRCNMKCVHCGSSAGSSRKGELGSEEWQCVIRELAALGAEDLVLLGGEPLLHPSWESLARLAVDCGLKALLITNGFLLDGPMARRCAQAGVARVGVSIDGASDAVHDRIRSTKGSYDRAWRAVHALLDAGICCTVITAVSKLNIGELPRMRDQIVGRGVGWQIQVTSADGARFDALHMVSRTEFYAVARFIAQCRETLTLKELPVAGAHGIGYHSTQLKNYAFMPEWPGCQGGISTVGVQSDGMVKPCLSMPEQFAEGNVREGGLTTLWKDPRKFRRNRVFRRESLQGECAGCGHGDTCRAGCPDLARNATGSEFDNPYCLLRIEKEGVDGALDLWHLNDVLVELRAR